MGRWLRRVRGALGMGVVWGIGWALAGLAIGVSSILFPGPMWETFFDVYDAPLPSLAMPGFISGAIFSVVLGVAARWRRFEELSMPRFTAWGAAAGVLLGAVPLLMLEGLTGAWGLKLAIIGTLGTLSGASAAATLAIARSGERRELGAGGEAIGSLPGDDGEREALPRKRE